VRNHPNTLPEFFRPPFLPTSCPLKVGEYVWVSLRARAFCVLDPLITIESPFEEQVDAKCGFITSPQAGDGPSPIVWRGFVEHMQARTAGF